MKIEFIRKTALSGDTNCPALYRTDRGTFLVQGWVVTDPETLAQVRDLGMDETVVEVPADVLTTDTAELEPLLDELARTGSTHIRVGPGGTWRQVGRGSERRQRAADIRAQILAMLRPAGVVPGPQAGPTVE